MNELQRHVYHIMRTIEQKGECGVSGTVDICHTTSDLITILKMLDYEVEYLIGQDLYKVRSK